MRLDLEHDEVDLEHGDLELEGRIAVASNATFVGTIGDVAVVYKPVAGERPLWDFPDGTLASREVAAYLVSQALGWTIVPLTWMREGPLGVGMVQRWQEPDHERDPVDVVPSHAVPDHWRTVLEGSDEGGRPLTVIHEDSAALRRIAVFDVLVNNADRKGSHILPVSEGHRYGVDHGVTFHTEPKLRTVLWGWMDEALDPDEIAGITQVRAKLDGELGEQLATLLSGPEIEALTARCERLLATRTFPRPEGDAPAVPWPLF
ncbi:SCO1664 family protein [Ruania halotolerans]|uniref:SCO1664 family protein n=1 Tax=Ruania halotolerans TaxID=2897773 RepID=UPI001E45D7B2|nr:SCO1664 family protein [Ruania halotolerans]UFU07337.1 SCO1664 family protein [Ruania halotolerans]